MKLADTDKEGDLCGHEQLCILTVMVVTQIYTCVINDTELYAQLHQCQFPDFNINYNFIKPNHQGNRRMNKWYTGPHCTILVTSCKSVIISK